MGIRDHVSGWLFCHSLGVARRYIYFIHSILDLCLVRILRKFCPGVCPVVCLVQHYRFSTGLSVCFQLYADAFRSDSILVVTVCPYFSYTYTCLFRWIAVRQGRYGSVLCCISQAVAFRHISFTPAVYDIRSVCFLREVIYGCCPAIIFIQGNCCSCRISICKEVDDDTCWSLSILVIAVVPYFSDGCLCCLCCMGVGDYIRSLCFVCCHSLGVTSRYADFVYRVFNIVTSWFLFKITPCIFPTIIFI